MIVREVNLALSPFEILSVMQDKKHPIFLDSAMGRDRLGKYSFLAFEPSIVIRSKNEKVTVEKYGDFDTFTGNPLEVFKDYYHRYKMDFHSDLPFIGGWMGYFSYDLCHHIEKLPSSAIDDTDVEDMFFGLYDTVLIFDHVHNLTYISSLGIDGEPQENINRLFTDIQSRKKVTFDFDINSNGSYTSNMTIDEYKSSIRKIKDYIRSGDIYQANFTQRFELNSSEPALKLYNRLRTINPAPFGGFIDTGKIQILSSSPERFISLRKNKIETRPIKGTRPRGKSLEEDIALKEDLQNAEKDRSELLMIVDLERNDIGKVSKTNTVKVPELFEIETYPTVHHLVSTVVGELKENLTPIDLVNASFPGGSITGAPKIRAMEVIDELEPTKRNIYTGSIGYIGLNGDMDLNIVIRTIVKNKDKAYFQVGGGIVWDSDEDAEYQESLDKGEALLKTLRGEGFDR